MRASESVDRLDLLERAGRALLESSYVVPSEVSEWELEVRSALIELAPRQSLAHNWALQVWERATPLSIRDTRNEAIRQNLLRRLGALRQVIEAVRQADSGSAEASDGVEGVHPQLRRLTEGDGVSVVESLGKHDAFISHATEDKRSLVRPLAEELAKRGFSIWYDEFELAVGDSLRQSIDRGLRSSRFGIVVLSEAFFAKKWPQYELDGLLAKQGLGQKVILPIWHGITREHVLAHSPTLADTVALNSSQKAISDLAEELGRVLRRKD